MTVPPCSLPGDNPEVVQFDYGYRGQASSNVNKDVLTIKTHTEAHGVGIGYVTGDKYELIQVDHSDQTFYLSPPYNETIHSTSLNKIVGQGEGVEYQVTANIKLTYDQNNGVQYEIYKVDTDCK